jgi:hypothetical protein
MESGAQECVYFLNGSDPSVVTLPKVYLMCLVWGVSHEFLVRTDFFIPSCPLCSLHLLQSSSGE